MKLKCLKYWLTTMVSAGVVAGRVSAAPVTVQNFSFESPAVSAGDANASYYIPSWTGFGGGYGAIESATGIGYFTGDTSPNGVLPGTANGVQYFHVNGSAAGGPGGIYQDVGALQPNILYTLTVAVGQRSDIAEGQGTVSLINGTNNAGANLVSSNFDVTNAPSGSFADVTLTFVTGPTVSGDLTIVLQSTTGVQIGFDNVRLDASVPPLVSPKSITVQNSSFENPVVGAGGTAYSPLPGWATFGGGYPQIYSPLATDNFFELNTDGTLVAPGDGNQYFSVNGAAAGGPGGIYQEVSGLLPNTTYNLTVAVGWRGGIPNGVSSIELVNGVDNTGVVLASANIDVTTLTQETFTDFTITYTTGPAPNGDLTIVLQSTSGVQADFDNVRLTESIPPTADTVSVNNFSFEADVQTDGGQTTSTAPTGWSSYGPSIGTIRPDGGVDFPSYTIPPGSTLPAPGDAYQCAYANGGCGLFQDVGPLLPNKTYTLKVAVGARATVNWGEGLGTIQLVNGTDNTGTVLASTTVNNTNPPSGGTFSDFAVTFTTSGTVSGDLTVALNTTTAVQMCYDNVRAYYQTPTSLAPEVPTPTLSPAAAYAGDLVTATVAATGPGPLYYSWQYDNGTDGTTWTALTSFSTNSSFAQNTTGFTLPAYKFRVIVTNVDGASTSYAATLVMTNGAPVSMQNPAPQLEGFTATQTAQFTAALTGTRPLSYQWLVDRGDGNGLVNVTNGTFNSPTLILPNLQLTDGGSYYLMASNSYGMSTNTTAGTLGVFALPSPDANNNLVLNSWEAPASGQPDPLPYVLAVGSLIAGANPSDIGAGNFQEEGCAGYSILTDGTIGLPGTTAMHAEFATVGVGGGTYLTYTLNTNASPKGYNLNQITAFGGWADYNRNQVSADVYYSTVSDPTSFIYLGSYSNNGGPVGYTGQGNPIMAVQMIPASGWLATNVACIKFDFTGPNGTGGAGYNGNYGYSGLSELQVFGQSLAASPINVTRSGANLTLTWTAGTLYSASNVTGPWSLVSGASSPWKINTTAPKMFYRLQ